jgi:hypothetical protein
MNRYGELHVNKGDTQVIALAGLLLLFGSPRHDRCQISDWSPFDLSVQEIKKKIEDLNQIRARSRRWLAGTSLCGLGITIVSLLLIRNAAVGLLQDGPTHDEFVTELTRQISKQVMPQINGSGIQASYGTLALPDAALPIPHHHNSSPRGGAGQDHGVPLQTKASPSIMSEEKLNTGACGAADDPQKPLGRFREQTVSEYQTTVTRIVDDLATIRGEGGNGTSAGLSAGTVASLFVSHVQEGLPKPSLEGDGPPADLNSKDAR